MAPRDIVSYVFLAVAWGLSFLVLVRVVDAFGWVGAVSFRCLLAGGLLWLVALPRRRLRFNAGWRHYAAVGATTVAGQLVCLSYATPRIGTAMAAILVAAIPLFSMVIAQFWGIEKITRQRVAGLVLGIIGIVLLVGFPAVPLTGRFVFDSLVSLGGSFFAAFGSNYVSRHLGNEEPWEVTSASFLCGGIMVLPLLYVVPVPAVPGAGAFLDLLILGGIMSALTYVVYFRLVSTIGATRAISVEFAVTVVAVLVGALVLDEPLTLVQLVGGAVIIAGCALVLGLVPWRSRGADLDTTMPGHG
jgi:drug/metabolite transporter (DMT)-like permease